MYKYYISSFTILFFGVNNKKEYCCYVVTLFRATTEQINL